MDENLKYKKVLHFITGIELGGGAENMLLQLLPKMETGLENRVCAVIGRGEVGKKLENLGIQVYYLDLQNIFDFGVIWRYQKVLKDFKPDIQVNYLIHADIFGRIFGRIFGVKKIISYIRGVHIIKTKKVFFLLDRFTLFLSNFVLTNSETTKNFYLNKMGIKEEKIACIPNAIEIEKFEHIKVDKNEKLKSLNLPEDKIIIGTVSRLDKIKDIPTIIRAFNSVYLEKNQNIHLLIIGSGKEEESILNLIEKLNLQKNISLLKNRGDITEILSIIDIFALASLSEGMSNALLEAMAAKKAIVTSDIEENRELIKDGVNGLNFQTGDPDDLAKKIIFYLENLAEADKFKVQAYATILNKYSLSVITRRYTDLLLNI